MMDDLPDLKDPRLRKLRIRSWRRGTKEMDLILGPFADARLSTMSASEVDHYEELLNENDQELYAWVSGRAPMSPKFQKLLTTICEFHEL